MSPKAPITRFDPGVERQFERADYLSLYRADPEFMEGLKVLYAARVAGHEALFRTLGALEDVKAEADAQDVDTEDSRNWARLREGPGEPPSRPAQVAKAYLDDLLEMSVLYGLDGYGPSRKAYSEGRRLVHRWVVDRAKGQPRDFGYAAILEGAPSASPRRVHVLEFMDRRESPEAFRKRLHAEVERQVDLVVEAVAEGRPRPSPGRRRANAARDLRFVYQFAARGWTISAITRDALARGQMAGVAGAQAAFAVLSLPERVAARGWQIPLPWVGTPGEACTVDGADRRDALRKRPIQDPVALSRESVKQAIRDQADRLQVKRGSRWGSGAD